MSKISAFVICSLLIIGCSAQQRDERDIINDVGTLAGKLVGKAWRTVMPGDVVRGSIVGAEDKQYHGQPEGGPWGGIPPPGYPGYPGYPPYGYPPPQPLGPYYY